jgi:superfamily II DNA/RNA helicase
VPRPSSRGYSPRRRPAAPAPRRSRWDDLPVTVVADDDTRSFRELGLPRGLANALSNSGIVSPFPIQAATIPDILAGRDLLGRAATGSGKTLAFGLPLIARLEEGTTQPRHPRGLILVPTRELAMQVCDTMAPLAQARGISVRLVAGGLAINKQITALDRGVDILVATPGRLVDLIERRACSLDSVEITVLDEADHMADLGFLPVVRSLLDQTPANGQRLLFSATLDGDVGTLVDAYLTNPAAHAVASSSASIDTMSHHVFRVPADAKFDLVAAIAARQGRTICFVRTKHGTERLARNLGRVGVAAGALHGGRTQSQRNRALDAFRDGSVPVLIATDVAARGIHVDDVSLVLHVDPPQDGKDYLHRSGRTARAGESGVVVLLSTPDEDRAVRRLLNEAGVRPDQRDARAGDEAVATVTGARRPSGVAIAAPRPSAASHASGRPHRPRRGTSPDTRGVRRRPVAGQGAGGRSTQGRPAAGNGGSGSRSNGTASGHATNKARHPQHAERRPRRARAH